MKYLSRKELEGIAERVVIAYRKLPEAQNIPYFRIEPELLTEKLLGLTLEFEHLSLDGKTLGLTSYDEIGVEVFDVTDEPFMYLLDGKTILIERALKEDITKLGRYNFSIIHEAAHRILQMMFPKEYGLPSDIGSSIRFYRLNSRQNKPIEEWDDEDWEEWQANVLASAILMPKEAVEIGMYNYGISKGIDYLNRVFRPVQYESFCRLANFLGVSKKALAVRMKYLGYIKCDQLDDPMELIDVTGG